MHSNDSSTILPAHLQAFREQALAEGYEEPLLRHWDAHTIVPVHSHPFDAFAVLVSGEMVLKAEGRSQILRTGDRFALMRNVPHEEHYGPDGAAFWVARRHPVPPATAAT